MAKFLLAADVDQIQAYIFGTDRMRTIRGASALVAHFGEEVRRQALAANDGSCDCLRHQGGQYLFICDKPDELARLIQKQAYEIGGEALSATVAWGPYPGDGGFASTLSTVFDKIKTLKDANQRGDSDSHSFLGGGFIRHCDLCKQYPTRPNPRKPDDLIWSPGNDPGEVRHLCNSCWKRKQGSEVMKLDKQLEAYIRTEQTLIGQHVWPQEFKPKFPSDLEQIWPAGQEGRLIGMVMADGDGIGQLLDHIPGPTLYHDFAQAIERVSLQAVARAICEIGLDRKPSGWIDLLPIIYGGDDLTFYLPAEKALAFALALGNAFADFTGRDQTLQNTPDTASIQSVLKIGRPGHTHLTLSMGIVAAKPSFPFTAMRSLAKDLRQNAKRQRVVRQSSEGMVDFAMITSASAELLSGMRAHYTRKDSDGEYILTSWPYAFSDLESLLNLRRQVIGIPRSQRKFLYAEFWRTRSAVESAYRSLLKKNNLSDARSTLKNLGCIKPDESPFCGPERERTALLDALEIAELVDERRPA